MLWMNKQKCSIAKKVRLDVFKLYERLENEFRISSKTIQLFRPYVIIFDTIFK